MDKELFKVDKKAFSIVSLNDNENDNDVAYWLSKTPQKEFRQ